MIVFGQFRAFVINAVVRNHWGHIGGIWCVMLLATVPPASGMLRVPESPRWLMAGREQEAVRC